MQSVGGIVNMLLNNSNELPQPYKNDSNAFYRLSFSLLHAMTMSVALPTKVVLA